MLFKVKGPPMTGLASDIAAGNIHIQTDERLRFLFT